MVETRNRGIDRGRNLTRIDGVPVTGPQPTVEGSPHAERPGSLHVPLPAVSHMEDLGRRDTGAACRLGKDPGIGLARPNVRRGNDMGKSHFPGPLQERFPSRPRSGGVRGHHDGNPHPVQLSYESLGLGIDDRRMFLESSFSEALDRLLNGAVVQCPQELTNPVDLGGDRDGLHRLSLALQFRVQSFPGPTEFPRRDRAPVRPSECPRKTIPPNLVLGLYDGPSVPNDRVVEIQGENLVWPGHGPHRLARATGKD